MRLLGGISVPGSWVLRGVLVDVNVIPHTMVYVRCSQAACTFIAPSQLIHVNYLIPVRQWSL